MGLVPEVCPRKQDWCWLGISGCTPSLISDIQFYLIRLAFLQCKGLGQLAVFFWRLRRSAKQGIPKDLDPPDFLALRNQYQRSLRFGSFRWHYLHICNWNDTPCYIYFHGFSHQTHIILLILVLTSALVGHSPSSNVKLSFEFQIFTITPTPGPNLAQIKNKWNLLGL